MANKKSDKNKDNPNATIILNAVLTYIHSMFMNKDKLYVQERTLRAFDLQALHKAHKDLFLFLQPNEKYGYYGPRVDDEMRKVAAFEEIYSKMQTADAIKNAIFACPSRDLRMIPMTYTESHAPCTQKINSMKHDMQQQIDEMKNSLHAVISRNKLTSIPTNVQPSSNATASTPLRPRTDSLKRKASMSSDRDGSLEMSLYEDAVDLAFIPVTHNNRKKQRLENNMKKNVNSTQVKNKEAVWGKGQGSTAGFQGVPPKPRYVPQVFIFRCNPQTTTEEIVKNHLLMHDIKVLEVKQKSHEQAQFKSFKVTVEKQVDFNKLISGEFVPQYVKVKRYFTPRSEREVNCNKNFFRGWEDSSSNGAATAAQSDLRRNSDVHAVLESADGRSDCNSHEADAMDTVGDSAQRILAQITAGTAETGSTTDISARNSTSSK